GVHGRRLCVDLAVGKLRLEPLQPIRREVVGKARSLLSARVQGEQLPRELAEARAGAGLEVLPGLAAELRERGRGSVGADVLRDLRDLLVRNVEPVVPPEAEKEVVPGD